MGMASIERTADAFGRLCGGSRAVSGLVIANCSVFLLILLAEIWMKAAGMSRDSLDMLLALPSPFAEAIRHPWTLLTYMVTQFSFLHLLFNMLWFICFGGLLREATDDKTILLLYAGAGIAGGIIFETAATINNATGTLTGASAAVLGIMAATAITIPDRRVRLFLLGEVKIKWIAIGMILLTFAGGGWRSSDIGGFQAHCGGTLFGVAAALIVRKRNGGSTSGSKESPGHVPGRAGVRRAAKVMAGRLSDPARLDQLLDKIRVSGYASLSAGEQHELEEISRRLNH